MVPGKEVLLAEDVLKIIHRAPNETFLHYHLVNVDGIVDEAKMNNLELLRDFMSLRPPGCIVYSTTSSKKYIYKNRLYHCKISEYI